MSNAIPNGFHTVTPHLVCAGAGEAMDFYKNAFGAEELMRLHTPDGKLLHGCVRIGDSAIMLVDEMPQCGAIGAKTLKGSPVTIHLFVGDVDAFFSQATAAGATAIMPPDDMFWGDRYGVLEDPFGHRWSVATHVRDVSLEELQDAVRKQLCSEPAGQ